MDGWMDGRGSRTTYGESESIFTWIKNNGTEVEEEKHKQKSIGRKEAEADEENQQPRAKWRRKESRLTGTGEDASRRR
jgi:hypothetical protein